MNPVSVRDARADDARAIAEVAATSWRETYRGIFEPAEIEDFLARSYQPEALAAQARRAAQDEEIHFLVCEREGSIVGFAHFGNGQRGPELFRIYAHPDHYGTGVGSALLAELHRRLAGRVESYVLDVHPDNVRGRAFYERNGFALAGEGSTPECHLMLRRTVENA